MEVKFEKDDLYKLIYWIVCKFKEDEFHHQAASAKSDLIGGFFDRWLNRAPEFLIFRELLKGKNYMATVIFQSIPIKIALTGFLYYLAPLYLKELGNSQSDIGRIIIGYGLAMVFISPLVGRVTDRLKSRKVFIIIGGLAAGAAMLSFIFLEGTAFIFLEGTAMTTVVIALTGLAHSLAISPQISLITESRSAQKIGSGGALGVFRFLERFGGTLGPPITGALVASFGFPNAIASIGGIGVVGTLLFFLLVRERRDPTN